MALLSVELTQVATVEPTGFQVVNTITSFTNLPDDGIFLFREDDDGFERVCANYDYQTYPVTKTASIEFYRLNSATIIYPSANEGTDGKQEVIERVTLLIASLQESFDNFEGTTVTDIPS